MITRRDAASYCSNPSVLTPKPEDLSCDRKLALTVVFTDVRATLLALKRAAELAHELDRSIRVLVPQVVPYALPIDRPAVQTSFRARQFSTWFQDCPIGTYFDVRLCRDRYQCLRQALDQDSIVLIGGGGNRFRSIRGGFLARWLRRSGHQVMIVTQ